MAFYTNECTRTEGLFESSEHLWMWFIFSKKIKPILKSQNGATYRPCEIIDIECLITKLHLSGQLSENELKVLLKYGMKQMAPLERIFSQRKDYFLWKSSMETLDFWFQKKGWIA